MNPSFLCNEPRFTKADLGRPEVYIDIIFFIKKKSLLIHIIIMDWESIVLIYVTTKNYHKILCYLDAFIKIQSPLITDTIVLTVSKWN